MNKSSQINKIKSGWTVYRIKKRSLMKRGGSSIRETRDSTELFGIHGIGDMQRGPQPTVSEGLRWPTDEKM